MPEVTEPLLSDARIAELVRPHAVTPEARKVLAEMVREASRETAEACAKVCEWHSLEGESCASAIRRAVLREQEE